MVVIIITILQGRSMRTREVKCQFQWAHQEELTWVVWVLEQCCSPIWYEGYSDWGSLSISKTCQYFWERKRNIGNTAQLTALKMHVCARAYTHTHKHNVTALVKMMVVWEAATLSANDVRLCVCRYLSIYICLSIYLYLSVYLSINMFPERNESDHMD